MLGPLIVEQLGPGCPKINLRKRQPSRNAEVILYLPLPWLKYVLFLSIASVSL